ncbi:gliding motility-associated ABC transporter substrate-binding protein GldG [Marivirga sp. S37H4]|uniref:Gliding motility-associated ABC transporter substrate-binding protein GldG n=1 Tax=Marivirga aurantiaca TaxID=2802615 RepID=A0A935CAI3_9BACT|nr:gliding motility-associated ABC transporter substrate-binding protein GldG [Marivirga aurantiaca]MBK6266217.1 gliding motility-associated ABC transporter substrate-binding protein GldG [Marivirga aurantiaca]
MEFLNRKTTEYTLKFLIALVLLLLVNFLVRYTLIRWDLTEENRYTMSEATQSLLQNLEEPLYVEVYLAGDINPEFSRLQTAIKQTLGQFKEYAHGNLQYSFVNPDEAESKKARNQFYNYLIDKGIPPTTVYDDQEGRKSQKMIFPGAEISYKGQSLPVILLSGNNAAGAKEAINQSVENLEYELANTIKTLSDSERKKIALIQGHGEPSGAQVFGLKEALEKKFDIFALTDLSQLSHFDAALFVKPTENFTNSELYDIDQYIMQGGKTLFFLDGLSIAVDSIKEYGAMALPIDNNLDDILFKYGVRVNKDVLQDVNSGNFPIVTGRMGKDPQIQLLPWPYYIIFNNYANHPIVKNLNAVYGKFVSSIDTIASAGVKKTPLIFTSDYTRQMNGPVHINFDDLKKEVVPENFNKKNIPVAYLLEGNFSSAYKNRLPPKTRANQKAINQSEQNSIIVVSDGDLLLSEINKEEGTPFPLGVDPYARHPTPFANEQLLLNMVNYMTDDQGLIISRNKEFKIRPLDKVKIAENKLLLQLLNVALPILLIILFGVVRYFWRKRKYASFNE